MVEHSKKLTGIKLIGLLLGALWCMVVLSCRADLVNEYTRRGDTDSTSKCSSGQVPVQLLLEGLSSATRTITPGHVTFADLADSSKYTLHLTGTSDMGDSRNIQNFSITSHGVGIFLLTPGSWILALTVTDVATSQPVLQGITFVVMENAPTSTPMTLKPVDSTGNVEVRFILTASLLNRLVVTNPNPPTATTGLDGATGSSTITVALYNSDGSQVVPGTDMTFSAQIASFSTREQTFVYNGNGQQIQDGQYTLKLTAEYAKQDGSRETTGYADILYVEGNRKTSATITLDDNSQVFGVPKKIGKANKATRNITIGAPNFSQSKTFNPYEEGLWIYAANWDGESNSTKNGNEVLTVGWDPVYDAEYYELEILVYPFSGYSLVVNLDASRYGRFDSIATTDEEWERYSTTPVSFGGRSKLPIYLKFNGKQGDANYYKTKSYTDKILNGNVSTEVDFTFCADKVLARNLITGTVNDSYRFSSTTDEFDTYGTFRAREGSREIVGKVGLEADCSAIGVLLPSFAPRAPVCIRMRSVNEFGYSDWVYWKGGKN